MFFQEPTPDTSGYMIAGYAIAFIVMALYVASLYLRARNLRQEATLLEEMEEPARPVQTSLPPQARKSPAKSPATSSSRKPAKTVTKKAGQK